MNLALTYIFHRFFYRLGDFFHHWYVDASRRFAYIFTSALEELDRTFAVKITLKYFFYPLYKDYSVMGRILGIIFRFGRILIGTTVYLLAAVIFSLIYLVWLAVPPAIIWYAFRSYP